MDETGELAAYLAAHPGKTLRDYKGKDTAPFDKFYVSLGEVPFDSLDRAYVRRRVDGVPARCLPRNLRQAAGRDPALTWDEATRAYHLASARKAGRACDAADQHFARPEPLDGAPAPSPADLGGAADALPPV